MPHQLRVRWPTNAPPPSCGRFPRHASTNSASSIHAKFQTRRLNPVTTSCTQQRPFHVILQGLHCRLKDHRLGLLKYCPVGRGFSRLIVWRISSSLHLCGQLLFIYVDHNFPVVALFIATEFVCIYLSTFHPGAVSTSLLLVRGVLHIRSMCMLFVMVVLAYTSF